MRTNVLAPLKRNAAVSKHGARSRRKPIVSLTSNIGSIAENRSGGAYVYRSSKAAPNAVMRSLAIDLRGESIAVALIHPGRVRTDMGGPGATTKVEQSVAALRRLIEELDIEDSGCFCGHDGKILPW